MCADPAGVVISGKIDVIAGDVIGGSKITYYTGESSEESERKHREILAAIAQERGVAPEVLRPIFDHLGFGNFPAFEIRRRAEEAIAAILEQAKREPQQNQGNEDITAAIISARNKLLQLDTGTALSGLQKKIEEEESVRQSRLVPLLREKSDIELKTYAYQAARGTLQQLTALAPSDFRAWVDLGDVCLAEYDPKAASAAYDQARILAHAKLESSQTK